MTGPPLISVCIPNYNMAGYLGDCLASVRAQSYPNLEVVVADDGSTDGSAEFLAAQGPGLKLLASPVNQGQSAAVNRAVAAARGRYAVVLHADDLLAPDHLARLSALLEARPRADLAYGEFNYLRAGQFLPVTPYYDRACLLPGLRALDSGLVSACFRLLFRRELWAEVGGLDPRYAVAQDAQIWVKFCLARGRESRVAYCPEVVGSYREHPATTSAARFDRFYTVLEHAAVFEDLVDFAQARCGLSPAERDRLRAGAVRTFLFLARRFLGKGLFEEARRTFRFVRAFAPDRPPGPEEEALAQAAEASPAERAALLQRLLPPGRPPNCLARSSLAPPPEAESLAGLEKGS